MSRYLVPLLTLTLFVPAAGSAPKLKDKPPSVPPIVGEWLVESRTIGGQAIVLPADGIRLIFRADGSYVWYFTGDEGQPDGHKYTLNLKAEPTEIDFSPRDNPKYLGVLKVEKDTLTLCYGPAGTPRPTAFESPAGSRAVKNVFRRVIKN